MTSIKPTDRLRTRDVIAAAKKKEKFGKIIPHLLLAVTSVTVLATFGIIYTLLKETFIFFQEVKITDFIFGTEWAPFSNADQAFGVLPLIARYIKNCRRRTSYRGPFRTCVCDFSQ